MKLIEFVVSVRCADEFAEIPESAVITVTEEQARWIFKMAKIVKAHSLYSLEKFSYGIKFDGVIVMESPCVTVGVDAFWYTAYTKYMLDYVTTSEVSFSDLRHKLKGGKA